MRTDSLSILIPAYNNAGTIARVIREAQVVGKSLGVEFEIVVFDDGSADGTKAIVEGLKPQFLRLRLLTHETNQGYGQTIKDLYFAGKYSWLFSLPGDFQFHPQELQKLWAARKKADMIIGRRVERKDNPRRLIQSKIYNWLLRLIWKIPTHDVNSIRLMRAAILPKLSLNSSSAFVDAELVIKATRVGFQVLDVPINHQADLEQTSGGGSLKTIVPVIVDLVKYMGVR